VKKGGHHKAGGPGPKALSSSTDRCSILATRSRNSSTLSLNWSGTSLWMRITPPTGRLRVQAQAAAAVVRRVQAPRSPATTWSEERSALPRYLQACVPSTFEETLKAVTTNKVAPFLQSAGDLGRATLRLQAETLAVFPSRAGRPEPMCALCGREPETPTHLLHRCRGLPTTRSPSATPPFKNEPRRS
jgi:hypothetical protein